MDQLDIAVHSTAHSSEGSAKRIAQQLGMSHQVLNNKCNSNNDTHKLTLHESRAMMFATGDLQILHALAADMDCIVQEAIAPKDDMKLETALLNIGAEIGDFHREVRDMLEDGRVSPRELARVRKEHLEAVRALNEAGVLIDQLFNESRASLKTTG